MIEFQDGYMAGTDWTCTSEPINCTTVDPDVIEEGVYGVLIGDQSGGFILFAGEPDPNDESQTFFTDSVIHFALNQEEAQPVTLPSGSVSYEGDVNGGVLINDVSDDMSGTVTITADFQSNLTDGTIAGQQAGTNTAFEVEWTDAPIMPGEGSFAGTDDTSYSFAGEASDGMIDGALYGPDANEATGGIWVGNEQGGATMVFVGEAVDQ